jgi:hypothetical protein
MSSTALSELNKIEASLWEAADQLRANSKLTSSEYCMPVLGVTNPTRDAVLQASASSTTQSFGGRQSGVEAGPARPKNGRF